MDAAEATTPSSIRNLFVSYAREDRELVDRLRAGLQRMHHEVWVDDRLSVGQAWWAEILRHIRTCDAVVVAVSPALLESQASALERAYARDLGKVILPVCVRAVIPELLPPDLAPLQMVDYSSQSSDAAFELAYAMAELPLSAPLPDPLPAPPPVPVSYLSDLTARVHAPSLSLDEQLALVSRLRGAVGRAAEREPALELLRSLQRREDLYHASARELEVAIAALEQQPTGAADGAREPRAAQGADRSRPVRAAPAPSASTSPSRPPPPPPPPPPGATGAAAADTGGASRTSGPRPAQGTGNTPPEGRPTSPTSRPTPAWEQRVPTVHRPVQQRPPQQQRAAVPLTGAGAPRDRPPNPHRALAITSLVTSVVTILITFGWAFPLLIGVVAMFSSRRVERQVRQGDLQGARRASRTTLVTGALGVVGSAIVLVLVAVLASVQTY